MKQGTILGADGNAVTNSDVQFAIDKIQELDKNKVYHVAIDKEHSHPASLRMFADAAKSLDVKLLITIGDTQITTLAETFNKLNEDQKNVVLNSLGYFHVDPINHEQTK